MIVVVVVIVVSGSKSRREEKRTREKIFRTVLESLLAEKRRKERIKLTKDIFMKEKEEK